MMDEITAQITMAKLRGKTPTCFDCQNANIIGGSMGSTYEPPEPDGVECQVPDNQLNINPEDYDYDEKILPGICGCFKPHMVTECGHCGKSMNIPEYLSNLSAYTSIYANEPTHVCSEECKQAVDEKLKQEQLEEEHFLKEWEASQYR